MEESEERRTAEFFARLANLPRNTSALKAELYTTPPIADLAQLLEAKGYSIAEYFKESPISWSDEEDILHHCLWQLAPKVILLLDNLFSGKKAILDELTVCGVLRNRVMVVSLEPSDALPEEER